MKKISSKNERIKREYFQYLAEARGRDEATIDGVASSLSEFEQSTQAKEFRRFHREQALAFKRQLAKAKNARTGQPLSKSTMLSTLRDLREFFFWLAHLPGFKSHIAYSDADYFNLSDKDVAIARARREARCPTIQQVRHVINDMPSGTVVERRNRALICLAMITGARVNALASFRLGHVNLEDGYVDQDARTVRTKAAKSFRTYFMPVDADALGYFQHWVHELRNEQLWGSDDPLFPQTEIGLAESGFFTSAGLCRKTWSTSEPVRTIFKRAFESAALPYFNPHSFRSMLVRHAMSLDLNVEEMKAWSQNLGHSDVMTTFTSYGQVPVSRQGDLIKAAEQRRNEQGSDAAQQVAVLEGLLARLRGTGSN